MSRIIPDAHHYTISQIVDRFVPNIVSQQIVSAENQLLYGGPGTGKTILLKRISWPATAVEANNVADASFLAFRCDMREMSILHQLFEEETAGRSEDVIDNREKIARCFATLQILHAIAESITQDPASELGTSAQAIRHRIASALDETASYCLGKNYTRNAELPLASLILRYRNQIRASLRNPERMIQLVPSLVDIVDPVVAASIFGDAVQHSLGLRPGILLDQYDMAGPDCQYFLNPLLRREHATSFFCIAAATPFSFTLAAEGGPLQPSHDFSFTVVEYFHDDFAAYHDLVCEVARRISGKDEDITPALEGGAEYFATMSSRSVRRFLQLCQLAGVFEASGPGHIPMDEQRRVVERVASHFREQIKTTDGVPTGTLWRLLASIARNARPSALESDKASTLLENVLPGRIRLLTDDMFGVENTHRQADVLLKRAFSEGAFLFATRDTARSVEVPKDFLLAHILGPATNATITYESDSDLGIDEVARIAKGDDTRRRRSVQEIDPVEEALRPMDKPDRIFLSISFEEAPEAEASRRAFQALFAEKDITVVFGLGLGHDFSSNVVGQIASCDVTLVDLTYLRPNIVFELGVAMGLRKRIIPVLNKQAGRPRNLNMYPFLASMGRIDYTFDQDDLRELRNKILGYVQRPMTLTQILETSMNKDVKLRVKTDPQERSFCVYYPEERCDMWRMMKRAVDQAVKGNGFRNCYFVQDRQPLTNIVENLVWSVCRSESVIIDTSGRGSVDLHGAFGLGFADALNALAGQAGRRQKRKQVLRIEQAEYAKPDELTMWHGANYHVWESQAKCLKLISGHASSRRRQRA